MVEFLDRDRRSNSVLPSRFGQGIKPPRRPNFAQNMHPNKRCRRSLARLNRSAPEYHDADHGVAVGSPRRFCVIAPIAFFVGGMGGWCCRTWCAVVFAVVLRSVVVIFVSCGEHDRKENVTELSVCAYVLPYHSSMFLHTNSENLVKCRLEPTQTATTS